jgi:hypothetical protein
MGISAMVSAQTRPVAGPFDSAMMNMQSPPAQDIAVRADSLFDRGRRGPVADSTEMQRVRFVMKGGVVFRNELK